MIGAWERPKLLYNLARVDDRTCPHENMVVKAKDKSHKARSTWKVLLCILYTNSALLVEDGLSVSLSLQGVMNDVVDRAQTQE